MRSNKLHARADEGFSALYRLREQWATSELERTRGVVAFTEAALVTFQTEKVELALRLKNAESSVAMLQEENATLLGRVRPHSTPASRGAHTCAHRSSS